MKKMSSNILVISLVAMTLAACGQPKLTENKPYVEPLYKEEVIFLEKFDEKHIDVLVGESKKMYAVPESLQDSIKGLEKNDKLTIEYSLDNELKRQVKSININGKLSEVVKAPQKTEPTSTAVKSESILKVYRLNSWTEEEAVSITNTNWVVKVLPSYELLENKVVSTKNDRYYVSFEKLPISKEIKPLRWAASDELKKIGELKEIKENQIYDPNFRKSEFVFTASNGEVSKKYIVRKEGKDLIQYVMVHPINDEDSKIEAELWAMMNGKETR